MGSSIKAIIFDVDGTFYEPIPELNEILHNYWIKRISDFKRIQSQEAETLYRNLKSQYKSSTRVIESLGIESTVEILRQAESFMMNPIRDHIKPDRKMVKLIKKLRSQFPLYTLRNDTRAGTKFILGRLGFENKRGARKGYGPFEDILPTGELGFTKPHPEVYKNSLKILGLKPKEVVMVGDRVDVDLAPAKKQGMKTVWISWGREPSDAKDIDVIIETIYHMEGLL